MIYLVPHVIQKPFSNHNEPNLIKCTILNVFFFNMLLAWRAVGGQTIRIQYTPEPIYIFVFTRVCCVQKGVLFLIA